MMKLETLYINNTAGRMSKDKKIYPILDFEAFAKATDLLSPCAFEDTLDFRNTVMLKNLTLFSLATCRLRVKVRSTPK